MRAGEQQLVEGVQEQDQRALGGREGETVQEDDGELVQLELESGSVGAVN